jgi:hypothetical protein
MLRVLLIGFLVGHGLVHVAIWAPKYDPEKPSFDASHSWLIGDQRSLAQVLAFATAAILILAGIALWSHSEWWRPTAVVGLSASTILLLLYFNPWYLFILAINIALSVGIAFMEWPAKTTVGA